MKQTTEQITENIQEQKKQRYIKAWNNHIDDLWTLAFTSDEEASQKVQEAIKVLKEQVLIIAETKTSFGGDL